MPTSDCMTKASPRTAALLLSYDVPHLHTWLRYTARDDKGAPLYTCFAARATRTFNYPAAGVALLRLRRRRATASGDRTVFANYRRVLSPLRAPCRRGARAAISATAAARLPWSARGAERIPTPSWGDAHSRAAAGKTTYRICVLELFNNVLS